ncbi:MAG: VCBS repeat-containing protein, partial [Acidobacteria bacterium]|nr:VCBS repeat-containing protein [Acidobacteriota bacterium]
MKSPRQRGHSRPVTLVLALLLLTACAGPGNPPEKPDALRAEFTAVAQALERAGALFIGVSQVATLQTQVAAAKKGTQDELDARGRLALELLRLGETEDSLQELRQIRKLEEQNWQALQEKGDEKDRARHLQRQRRILDKLLVASLHLGEDRNCVARHGSDACIVPVRGDGVHQDRQGVEAAMKYARAILAREPDDLKALWFLNLAAQLAGVYPAGVEKEFLIPPERFMATAPVPRFRNVAPALGLDTFDLAGGGIVEDLDNDGWLDILTSTMDPWGSLTLLHNEGDGTFINNTVAAGLDVQWGGLSMSAADYDNDGDVDVLVLRGGWLQAQGRVRNSLLRNNGDGTFSDVTRAAGVARPARPTQAAAWADYDLDGDLDLFSGAYTGQLEDVAADIMGQRPERPEQWPRLYRNDHGRFTDVTRLSGLD